MEMKITLICTRKEHPDTCNLCKNEGKDYCLMCPSAFTHEEYKQLYEQYISYPAYDVNLIGTEIVINQP